MVAVMLFAGLETLLKHAGQRPTHRGKTESHLYMKNFTAMVLGAALMCGPAFAVAQQPYPGTDSGAKQDMKNAGHETKQAAKDAAHGTKQGTKKAYHKTKRGTKKAYRKTRDTTKGAVEGAKEGAKTPE
jgi:hypothetical protein